MKKPSVSLCMIVKDEEKCLERCLTSVQSFVSEMIIVDTGSVDGTVEICKRFGAKIIHHVWNEDFAEARNIGIDHASGEWILWLDADEEWKCTQDDLSTLLKTNEVTVLSVPVVNYHGESEPVNEHDAFILHQYRLFKNTPSIRFDNPIHEMLRLHNNHKIITLSHHDISIHHYGYLKDNVKRKQKSLRNINLLLKEAEKSPDKPWTTFHLASEYASIQQFADAFHLINKAILQFIQMEKMPPSIFYRLKYGILIETNNIEGAWPAIEKAILLYPDYVDLHFYKGYILYHLGAYEESIKTFQHCLNLGENHGEHIILKGTGSFRALHYIDLCKKKIINDEEPDSITPNL